MATFLEQQLDYIIFVYGTAFFVLATACYLAHKHGENTLTWKWLFLFGITHGLNEWLDLAYLSLGGGALLTALRFSALTLSFLFLLEFGISGTHPNAKALKLVPALLGATLLLGVVASNFEFSVARYAMGFTGGLWASAALLAAGIRKKNTTLKATAAIMMLYALETGLVVDAAPFFPASILNFETFLRATGIPIHLIKAVTVYAASVAVLSIIRERSKEGQQEAPFHFAKPLAAYIILIIIGFFFTSYLGRHAEADAKRYLLSRAMTAAASIDPDQAARLTGTPADLDKPDYIRLKEQVQRIKKANPDCRYVYLMGLRGDKLIFLVDAEPAGSRNYTGPGYVYEDSTPAYVADFKDGRTTVYDVYTDSWGTWVTGSDYIRDGKGKVLAQFSMDVDAQRWGAGIREFRFFGILITFGILVTFGLVLLSISFYLDWLGSRLAAEREAERRVAIQRLAGEKKLREITSALGEGLIVQDMEGNIGFVNPEAQRLLGWSGQEITGTSLYKLLQGRDADGRITPWTDHALSVTQSTGETVRAEYESFTRKDGGTFPVSYVSSPIIEDGAITGVVLAFQDITERRMLERQTRDFYAMVTHDLKSPVAVIQGYTEVLAAKMSAVLDTDSKMIMGSIKYNCSRVFNLLEDFLTISRIESGALTLNESAEDVSELLTESCSGVSYLADQKKLLVETAFNEDLPKAILDRVQFQRAIGNLLVNAINYTPRGGRISIAASLSSSGEDRSLAVTVSDTGPGIPAGDEERIFEKYYRSRRTAGVKGSGLGLAIVRAVATAHGGKAALESSGPTGSTFRFSIPLKAPSTAVD